MAFLLGAFVLLVILIVLASAFRAGRRSARKIDVMKEIEEDFFK